MSEKSGWFEEWLQNNDTHNKDKKIKKANNKPFKKLKAHEETKNVNNLFTRTTNNKFDSSDKYLFEEWLSTRKIIDKDKSIKEKHKYVNKNIISIEKSIDLHNLTVYEALNTLKNFIIQAHKQKLSTILIIHGKGKHSENNTPKIKNAIINYLRKEGKQFVLQFREAPKRYGGEGASILWLKY